MKERPLLQRERLQLPAWDNCKNVQSRPKLEECGCPSCPPQHTKPSKSWLTSVRNQICFVFVWPKQKFQEHLSDVVTFDASAAGVSWGASAFAFRREQDWRISMAVLKNTKTYTSNLKQNYFRSSWKKVIVSVFFLLFQYNSSSSGLSRWGRCFRCLQDTALRSSETFTEFKTESFSRQSKMSQPKRNDERCYCLQKALAEFFEI